MAITSAAIYGIIGFTSFAGLFFLPVWPEFDLQLGLVTASVAMLTGGVFYLNRNRFPLTVAIFHMILAVGLTTAGLLAAGKSDLSPAISMIYILTSLHAFHFFSLAASLGVVAIIGTCFALIAVHYQWSGWILILSLLVGCCVTAGVVVNLLVRRLHQLATTDKLTGAYNRHTWDAMFELKLNFARRYHHALSLMIIDLDQFKSVNDTLGHQEGDRILQFTAQCIRDVLRSSDVSARWGGDEFILLLDNCAIDQALLTEKRLRDALEGTIAFTSGIAEFRIGDTTESLLCRADRKLLENKVLRGIPPAACSAPREPEIQMARAE